MFNRLRAITAWLFNRLLWVSWAALGPPAVRDVCRMTALSSPARVTGQACPRKSSVSCARVCLPIPTGGTPAARAPAIAAGQHDSVETSSRAPVLAQDERDFAGVAQRIHRHHNGSGVQHAVEYDCELGTARQHDPHPVARAKTSIVKVGGEPCGVVGELRIRRGGPVTAQRGAVGIHVRRLNEMQAHIGHDHNISGALPRML